MVSQSTKKNCLSLLMHCDNVISTLMPYVPRNPHAQSLLAVQQELQQRKQERESIDRRIAELEDAARALAPLAEGNKATPMTLVELCLTVLATNGPMRVPAIRDAILLMGVPLEQKNPLSVLHMTMMRLLVQKHVQLVAIQNAPNSQGSGPIFGITPAGRAVLNR